MQKTQLTDVVLAKIGSRPALPKARLAGIVILALLVFAGMRFYGHLAIEIIANRHSSSTAPIRISLDGHQLLVPKNLISDKHQRRGGEFAELDLYMRWPALSGFSYEHSVDFNTLNNIVLVSVRSYAAQLEQSRYLLLTEPGEIGPWGWSFARSLGARALTRRFSQSATAGRQIPMRPNIRRQSHSSPGASETKWQVPCLLHASGTCHL